MILNIDVISFRKENYHLFSPRDEQASDWLKSNLDCPYLKIGIAYAVENTHLENVFSKIRQVTN